MGGNFSCIVCGSLLERLRHEAAELLFFIFYEYFIFRVKMKKLFVGRNTDGKFLILKDFAPSKDFFDKFNLSASLIIINQSDDL